MPKRQPDAVFFQDWQDGMFTLRCTTKEQAIKVMQELWDDDPEFHKEKCGDIKFNEETVKEERMYTCNSCDIYTLGENVCMECGNSLSPIGRRTFSIYFN